MTIETRIKENIHFRVVYSFSGLDHFHHAGCGSLKEKEVVLLGVVALLEEVCHCGDGL